MKLIPFFLSALLMTMPFQSKAWSTKSITVNSRLHVLQDVVFEAGQNPLVAIGSMPRILFRKDHQSQYQMRTLTSVIHISIPGLNPVSQKQQIDAGDTLLVTKVVPSKDEFSAGVTLHVVSSRGTLFHFFIKDVIEDVYYWYNNKFARSEVIYNGLAMTLVDFENLIRDHFFYIQAPPISL